MIDFQTNPDRYRHWSLEIQGSVAKLAMGVQVEYPFKEGYELKLNSYDLAVDIELADAIQRIRFEHPQVKVVEISSSNERVFCAGANIRMLASSTHPFKVNFCKFTNETRLGIEDASRHSHIKWVAALNGLAAGGGYELALACDEIYLVDDGNSPVSLPEVALLGVLPGTGGLTRLVDKRMVRKDHADVFATLPEGLKGPKAKAWNLIDDSFPRSLFGETVAKRVELLAASVKDKSGRTGITLHPLESTASEKGIEYEFVRLVCDKEKRTATLYLTGPSGEQPSTPEEYGKAGDQSWILRFLRELDDCILQLRFCHEEIGLILLHTSGDVDKLLGVEKSLFEHRDDWLVNEIILYAARTLRRFELTARSIFSLMDSGSAFAGIFLELALAGDRIYMLDNPAAPVEIAIGPLSAGQLPMSNGLTRLECRFLANKDKAKQLAQEQPRLNMTEAFELGFCTYLVEDLDWADDLRIAIEERASLSPDALTGMEASLRFAGVETCDSKIFGRLSAWQNWIFTRPNATGEEGALVRYGQPEEARFDWRRT